MKNLLISVVALVVLAVSSRTVAAQKATVPPGQIAHTPTPKSVEKNVTRVLVGGKEVFATSLKEASVTVSRESCSDNELSGVCLYRIDAGGKKHRISSITSAQSVVYVYESTITILKH